MKRTITILEALSPIAHGDTVTGVDNATNTRLFMRQARLVNNRMIRTPCLSENALRSVLVRRPAHDHLLTTLNLTNGDIPQGVINLLFSGGNLAAGATQEGDDIRLGHDAYAAYPTLSLLGGAVDRFVLPNSKLHVCSWPITKEHRAAIQHVAPHLDEEAAQHSIFDWTADETRTRGTGSESEGNQMLYTYETITAGARFLVEWMLDEHTPPEVEGALALALQRWDGYFGGQGRQGRGRMTLTGDLPDAAPYLQHLDSHADAMRQGLIDGTLATRKTLIAA